MARILWNLTRPGPAQSFQHAASFRHDLSCSGSWGLQYDMVFSWRGGWIKVMATRGVNVGLGTRNMRWPNIFFKSSNSWSRGSGDQGMSYGRILIMSSKSWTRSDTYARAWGGGISVHRDTRMGTTWTMPRMRL